MTVGAWHSWLPFITDRKDGLVTPPGLARRWQRSVRRRWPRAADLLGLTGCLTLAATLPVS